MNMYKRVYKWGRQFPPLAESGGSTAAFIILAARGRGARLWNRTAPAGPRPTPSRPTANAPWRKRKRAGGASGRDRGKQLEAMAKFERLGRVHNRVKEGQLPNAETGWTTRHSCHPGKEDRGPAQLVRTRTRPRQPRASTAHQQRAELLRIARLARKARQCLSMGRGRCNRADGRASHHRRKACRKPAIIIMPSSAAAEHPRISRGDRRRAVDQAEPSLAARPGDPRPKATGVTVIVDNTPASSASLLRPIAEVARMSLGSSSATTHSPTRIERS